MEGGLARNKWGMWEEYSPLDKIKNRFEFGFGKFSQIWSHG